MALKFTIILQNLVTGDHRKNCESKYDCKLAEIDVVTTRIRYRVNGVLDIWLFNLVVFLLNLNGLCTILQFLVRFFFDGCE